MQHFSQYWEKLTGVFITREDKKSPEEAYTGRYSYRNYRSDDSSTGNPRQAPERVLESGSNTAPSNEPSIQFCRN
ncbi:MAG: hypothetical protein EOP48_16200 [Sphingobacteriales bacterium]|nr:MAG: hypothetical protein EOP48_16200 [Sphingobacteriales bacterium]